MNEEKDRTGSNVPVTAAITTGPNQHACKPPPNDTQKTRPPFERHGTSHSHLPRRCMITLMGGMPSPVFLDRAPASQGRISLR